ncbi:MAG: hypothetical protein NC187_00520 [Candidatus Amulumruptor caecigallinarius]|nr:hypothetical protein [Candidatus Amulumruptor caecigallinarius]MCM1395960.1 hypothetical protein [Candidatus Amulumruptor caecigallinarius]MCM1452995.1 hypothetical protein [bacterium]
MKLSVLRFCSLAAIAAAMTACSSDEPAQVATSDVPLQGVTITAQLPVENTLRPRAASNNMLASGNKVQRLIYAIYDLNTNEKLLSDKVLVTPGTKSFSFNVNLPVNAQYRLFMWADAGTFSKSSAEPYIVDTDAHTITMNTEALSDANWLNTSAEGLLYPVAEAQPDDMDAFMYFGSMFLTPASDGNSFTLTRPLVAMAFFSNATDAIYEAAKSPIVGSTIHFGDTESYDFADSYNYFDDTVTMHQASNNYVNYVDFANGVNSFFCPWGFSKYKVLAYQYSFAPKNAANIPFETASLFATFRYSDGSDDDRGHSYVNVDLGEPATWFKPNTCLAIIDDTDSNGGTSALISNTNVTAKVSAGFDSNTRY